MNLNIIECYTYVQRLLPYFMDWQIELDFKDILVFRNNLYINCIATLLMQKENFPATCPYVDMTEE